MTIKCQAFRDMKRAKKHARLGGSGAGGQRSKGKPKQVRMTKYGDSVRSDKHGKRPNRGTTARNREQETRRELRHEVSQACVIDLSEVMSEQEEEGHDQAVE